MKTILRNLLLVAFLFGTGLSSRTQTLYRYYQNWYFSGSVGTSTFYGDVSDRKNRWFTSTPFSTFFYEDRGASLTLDFGKNITPSFSVGLTASNFKLRGSSDLLRMYMYSSAYSYGAYARLHVLNAFLGPSSNRPLDVYGTVGIGGMTYTTYKKDQLTDSLIGINDPENPNVVSGTKLNSSTMLLNYGFGLDWTVADNFGLFIEMSSNAVFNDRLDAHVSDKRSFEGYGNMSIGLRYHFDSSPYMFQSRYPRYNGKSKDPAIREYNKKKATVMKTKQHKRALSKRFNTVTGKKKFSFRNMFRRTKLNFAK